MSEVRVLHPRVSSASFQAYTLTIIANMVSEKGQEQQDVERLLEQLQERMGTASPSTEEEWTDPTGGPLGDLFIGYIPRTSACAGCWASGFTQNLVTDAVVGFT